MDHLEIEIEGRRYRVHGYTTPPRVGETVTLLEYPDRSQMISARVRSVRFTYVRTSGDQEILSVGVVVFTERLLA